MKAERFLGPREDGEIYYSLSSCQDPRPKKRLEKLDIKRKTETTGLLKLARFLERSPKPRERYKRNWTLNEKPRPSRTQDS